MQRLDPDPHSEFEIVAPPTPIGGDQSLVLARGDTFAIFDRHAEMLPGPASRHGLYSGGTRFVSGLWLQIAGSRPLLLSSGTRDRSGGVFVNEASPDVLDHPTVRLERDAIHLVRRVSLSDDGCEIALALRCYGREPIALPVRLWFTCDYADVFEVRGARRPRRGEPTPPELSPRAVELGYRGLDGVARATRFEFDPEPAIAEPRSAHWLVELEPGARAQISVRITCSLRSGRTRQDPGRYAVRGTVAHQRDLSTAISTSSHEMNAWVRRSATDLAMLTVPTAHGPIPYAGIPWFCTPFGRDSLIAAYETLWIDPSLARGVLLFLAANQAEKDEPERDAEPGKIIHEMRSGEMAALHEVPFERYYGSVDATPLFALVASAYFDRTGDVALLEKLWPHLERALAWIDGPGDPDRDGFVEYERRSPNGLTNQGWKDSRDAIMHADGCLAEGPIALCEVQAYVYGARAGLARAARQLGLDARADDLASAAERMRDAFADAFWCEELGTYAIALDGRKQSCRVRSSNAGHVLLTGLARPEHAQAVGRCLLSADQFSGWGVRTLAASSRRYNPMSYHDGSVWPHDNALIAAGLARYGDTHSAALILEGLFDACRMLEDARLPELLCGFDRQPDEPPTLYPTACSPQAWAAGAVFLLLRSVLGLSIDAENRAVRLVRPTLPVALDRIAIHGLAVGSRSVDLAVERSGNSLELHVLRAGEGIDVAISDEVAPF
jgi:glycogen debranching enzyme